MQVRAYGRRRGRARILVAFAFAVTVTSGLGVAGPHLAPAAADTPAPFATQVAAGAAQSCSVMSDGTARCWGSNAGGDLGDGTTTDRLLPVTVMNASGTAPLSGITQIATGFDTCALMTDQTVECWGGNRYGNLGIGTTSGPQTCGPDPCSMLPVVVENSAGTGPLTNVVKIAAGAYRTCAVLSNHTLSCWGAAVDVTDTGQQTALPTLAVIGDGVTPLTGVADVSVGPEHTCALLTNSTAACWGEGNFGELGTGATTSSGYASFLVQNPVLHTPQTGIIQIVAGNDSTCVLMTARYVSCFGFNNIGQDGSMTTNGSRLAPTTVVQSADGSGSLVQVQGLTTVGNAACAYLADGTARCWGSDMAWALGDGGVVVNQPPWGCGGDCSYGAVVVENHEDTGPLTGIIGLSSGEAGHVCALLNGGAIQCWGGNPGLGDGTTINRCVPVTVGTVSPADPPPAAPTNVTASNGDREATVFWSPPPHVVNDCRLRFDFSVTASPGALVIHPDNNFLVSGAGGTLGTVFSGLTAGVTYTFTVAATNMTGLGASSLPSNSVTPTGIAPIAPDPPLNVTAIAGDQEAIVSWTAPPDNGAPIIFYNVQATNLADGSGISAPATHLTMQLLTNGTPYAFTVTATNSAGTSVASAVSNIVVPDRSLATEPDPPTNVVAVAGVKQAIVSWHAPVNDGLSPIGTYVVTASPGGATATVFPPTTTATFKSLTAGTSYTFSVTAANDIGTSPPSALSNPVVPAANPPTAPGPPTNVTAAPGNGSAQVSWVAPPDNGAAITGYTVTQHPGNGGYMVSASQTSIAMTGLTNGTTYTFTVHATNSIGDGPESASSNAVTPTASATAPAAPTSVSAVTGDADATVSWHAPSNNGGSPISSYTVTVSPGGAHSTVSGSTLQTDIANLIDGTSYTFTVRATNAIGDSPESAASSPAVPLGPPLAPTAVSASPLSGAATVTWQAPASDRGSPITGYLITTTPSTTTTHAASSQTAAIVAGLVDGITYTIRVRATNVVGDSVSSAPSNPIRPSAPPGAPRNVRASVVHGAVTVTWVAPSSNGSAITKYTVRASPGAEVVAVSAAHTQATVAGLAPGAHTFKVRATNARGTGSWSSASNPVSLASVASTTRSGYWMLGANGAVYAFGDAPRFATALRPTVAIAARRDGTGYWTTDSAGSVSGFGTARNHGAPPALHAGEAVSTISSTPSGNGYWLFTDHGRAFAFGDAHFYGDMSGAPLNGPVIASVATPTGHGYYMVGSDGGVFNFGDARFYGSTGALHLNRPIVGISPTPDNRGYWLVASDGGVFAFHAPFRGSMGGAHLNRSVNGLVSYGNGYLMVASDGGIFDFSNKQFAGSLASNPPAAPIVGIAAFTSNK